MASIRAYIENIIYYNEDNYYAVLEASDGSAEFTLVGHFPYISAGETLEAEGSFTRHPVYGEQFSAVSFKIIEPEGADAMERYQGHRRGAGEAHSQDIQGRYIQNNRRGT